MPVLQGFTVSADSKRSDNNYGSNGVFLSASILPIAGENLDQLAQDIYLSLKAKCNHFLTLDPEKMGFKDLNELMNAKGIVITGHMEEPETANQPDTASNKESSKEKHSPNITKTKPKECPECRSKGDHGTLRVSKFEDVDGHQGYFCSNRDKKGCMFTCHVPK